MKQAAQAAEAVNLRNQIEAARNRLLKELGRTLRCIGSGDLNAVLRQQIERESQSNERYRDLLTVALCTLFCTPTVFFERI